MRIYISVDMEGISGVTRWQDVITDGQDYQRARSWMTADVNAAIAGARAAGATEFVVEENHGVEMLCNLLLDEIDPEAEVVRGLPRADRITDAALDDSMDALFLVGHHAKAGDYPGICAHTISYGNYKRLNINGVPAGEGQIFSAIAAEAGVPTALIAGDDVVCAELARLCPGIETAQVKVALSRTAGRIIPPVRAQEIIRAAAERATQRVASREIEVPAVTAPYEIEVELRAPIDEAGLTALANADTDYAVEGDRLVRFSEPNMIRGYRGAAMVQFLVGG